MLRIEMTPAKPAERTKKKVELPRWPGIVRGRLSRAEIYEDAIRRHDYSLNDTDTR